MASCSSQRQQSLNCRFVAGGTPCPAVFLAAAARSAAAAAAAAGDDDGAAAAAAAATPAPPPLMRFAYASTSRRRFGAPRLAPFASISVGSNKPQRQPQHQQLFSLAVTTTTTNSEQAGSSGSGNESDSDDDDGSTLSEGEVAFLQNTNCGCCSRALLPKRRGRPPLLRRPPPVEPADFLVCDGCRRCFHEACADAAGAGVSSVAADGAWWHDPSCRATAAALDAQAARAGDTPLPGGRSWRLVELPGGRAARQRREQQKKGGDGGGGKGGSGGDSEGSGGLSREARKAQLHALLDVLAPEYGPGVADRLADGGGHAFLLRSPDGEPVAAATLAVCGPDLAALDLLTTAFAARGQGHARALLSAAESFLGARARVSRLVAVASADEARAAEVLCKKLGFRRLGAGEARRLAADFPALQAYERPVLLSRDLSRAARAAALQAAAARGGKAAEAADAATGQAAAAAGANGGGGASAAEVAPAAAASGKRGGWWPW